MESKYSSSLFLTKISKKSAWLIFRSLWYIMNFLAGVLFVVLYIVLSILAIFVQYFVWNHFLWF